MSRPSWDDTWFAVAQAVSRRSLCNRDQVGAVIVDPRNRIIATGYNGPPAGFIRMDPTARCGQWCVREVNHATPPALDYSDCPSLHAEANALSVCDRSVREGGTIYVTSHTCMGCAKLIANSGLSTLHVYPGVEAAHRNPANVYAFLEQCGITVYVS